MLANIGCLGKVFCLLSRLGVFILLSRLGMIVFCLALTASGLWLLGAGRREAPQGYLVSRKGPGLPLWFFGISHFTRISNPQCTPEDLRHDATLRAANADIY